MKLFKNLFNKKPKAQEPAEPEPVPEQEPSEVKPTAAKKQEPKAGKKTARPPASQPKKKKPSDVPEKVSETLPWRTFSIFISSTFADMQAERDHLKNVVFPQVEEELQKRRIKLEIVDLRWGVDTTSMEQEEEREANVLKVCLDEIKRCRPFFIGLLGDRYGWVPPEKRMSDAVVGEGLKVALNGKSVTDLEIEFGVLASKEQLVRSAFYFRVPLPYDQFPAKRAALFSDQHNPDLSPVDKAGRKAALDDLKAKILKHFEKEKHPEKVKTYTVGWDAEKEKVTGLEAFGNLVYDDILAECEGHASETWDKVPKNWQEQELALLDSFIEGHTHVTTFITEKGQEHVPTFCGRKPLLEELKRHLLSDDAAKWGMVLTGESGSGKSAVFSMVYKMMEKEDCLILAHSAGLSPRAKHLADLLKIWNNLLRKELGMEPEVGDTSPPPPSPQGEGLGVRSFSPEGPGVRSETPIEQLQQQFAELLSMAATKKRVVLLIDALDRFEPTGRAKAISWLPTLMPANARLLLTAITGTEKEAAKYHRGLQTRSIDIFTLEEAREMLDTLGRRYHKTLNPGIARLILEKQTPAGHPAVSSPLWLSLAVNILMAIDQDDFEQMSKLEGRADQQIETYLTTMAKGFDPLPGKLFLSLIEKAGILFGTEFTHAVFNYLAVSRNGLREKDLAKLLFKTYWDPLLFAHLRRWFKTYLTQESTLSQWNFNHSILKDSVVEKINKEKLIKYHIEISSYLFTLRNDIIKSSELMYHFLRCNNQPSAAKFYALGSGEEIDGSNISIADSISNDINNEVNDTLEWVAGLLFSNGSLTEFQLISKNLQHELNLFLKARGMTKERLKLLQNLKDNQEKQLNIKSLADGGYSSYDKNIKYNWVYLYQYAQTLVRMGEIYYELGDKNNTLNCFKSNKELLEIVIELSPDFLDAKINFTAVCSHLGVLYKSISNYNIALEYLTLCEKHLTELLKNSTDNLYLNYNISICYLYMGEIFLSLNQYKKSLHYFEQDILFTEKLLKICNNEDVKTHYITINSKLANYYYLTGCFEKEKEYLFINNKTAQEFFQSNPESIRLKKSLGLSYFDLGNFYKNNGNLSEALSCLLEQNAIHKEIYQKQPFTITAKTDLGISYRACGELYEVMCQYDKALDMYVLNNQLMKELVELNPEIENSQSELAISYFEMAKIYSKIENFRSAIDDFLNAIEILKIICQKNVNNEEFNGTLSSVYRSLGFLYKKLNQNENALKYIDLACEINKDIMNQNSLNINAKYNYAISLIILSDIYQCMGKFDNAIANCMSQNEIITELYIANSSNSQYKIALAMSYGKLGEIYQQSKQYELSVKNFEIFLRMRENLSQDFPDNIHYNYNLAMAYEKYGIALFQYDKEQSCIKYINRGYEIICAILKVNSTNTDFLNLFAELYLFKAVFNSYFNEYKLTFDNIQESISIWTNLLRNTGVEIYKRKVEVSEKIIKENLDLEAALNKLMNE